LVIKKNRSGIPLGKSRRKVHFKINRHHPERRKKSGLPSEEKKKERRHPSAQIKEKGSSLRRRGIKSSGPKGRRRGQIPAYEKPTTTTYYYEEGMHRVHRRGEIRVATVGRDIEKRNCPSGGKKRGFWGKNDQLWEGLSVTKYFRLCRRKKGKKKASKMQLLIVKTCL